MLAIIQSTTRRLRLVSSGNYQYLFFAAIVTALFMLAPLQSVQAQCPCASATFQVGTGITPTPVPNMAAAIAIYGAGFSTLTSACVKINGQFTVESGTWSLTSTNVVFDNASSSLFVLGGASLIASAGSTFTPCSTSFMGIYGQTGSTINMNQCTVQGASNAGVSVLANATFSITGNTFDNCNKGLSVGGLQNTANHTVSGNTFKFCTNGIYLGAAVNVNIGSNSYTNFGGQA
ncbi:MAG: right-handed parallel beta-helix repeat-containing protein [Lewinellaceae bacterium]|nr:right-handed parallel beta-helix repeat-containing protein [Lewinellaceae bacterium]